jgi:hypothetical protein
VSARRSLCDADALIATRRQRSLATVRAMGEDEWAEELALAQWEEDRERRLLEVAVGRAVARAFGARAE